MRSHLPNPTDPVGLIGIALSCHLWELLSPQGINMEKRGNFSDQDVTATTIGCPLRVRHFHTASQLISMAATELDEPWRSPLYRA